MKEVFHKLTESVRAILSSGTVDGNKYFLQGQLSRAQYLEVDKALKLLGGKWDRTKKAHIFPSEKAAQSVLNCHDVEQITDKKKSLQFFETPEDVAKIIVTVANIYDHMRVLEPSAGRGAILKELPKCVEAVAVEADKDNCAHMRDMGFNPICTDFLAYHTDRPYDRIVMNPPFSKEQVVHHVLHAWELLKVGGRLVSVAPENILEGRSKAKRRLREIADLNGGKTISMPENSFKKSGTGVRTCLLILDKR